VLSRKEFKNRRGDAKRLWESNKRCEGLRRPGGPFELLSAVCRKTGDLGQFLKYMEAAALAHPEIQQEMYKPVWTRASFNVWRKGNKILDNFFEGVRSGSVERGTAGRSPIFLVGDSGVGKHVSVGRGRPSSPSTVVLKKMFHVARRTRFLSTEEGDFQRLPPLLKLIYLVSEFRSTMLCHCCFQQLEPVRALTPRRVYRDAERRRAKWEERWGPQWVGRPVPKYTNVSRLQRCDNPECPVGFVHRDKHPPLAMIENAISLAQGQGGVPEMRRGWGRMERVRWVNGGFTLNSSVRALMPLSTLDTGRMARVWDLLCSARKYLANQRPKGVNGRLAAHL
jgi:hypothetical protein